MSLRLALPVHHLGPFHSINRHLTRFSLYWAICGIFTSPYFGGGGLGLDACYCRWSIISVRFYFPLSPSAGFVICWLVVALCVSFVRLVRLDLYFTGLALARRLLGWGFIYIGSPLACSR
jgi:hypothetical protein